MPMAGLMITERELVMGGVLGPGIAAASGKASD